MTLPVPLSLSLQLQLQFPKLLLVMKEYVADETDAAAFTTDGDDLDVDAK